jgi:tRNA(Ile)-lysidine synthetase-like protein
VEKIPRTLVSNPNNAERASRRAFEAGVLRLLRSANLHDVAGVVVAVSGGADSTAMLLAMAAVKPRWAPDTRLVACYVDHGLRPQAQVEAEKTQVARLCVAVGIPLRRTEHLSIEDAARRCRYAALAGVARECGALVIVTGHTADDQIETVLLRLMRGSGLRGLRGIPAVSTLPGEGSLRLVRPLLFARRSETEAYCTARGESWATDESNSSPRFLRNRVRHELVPLLRDLWSGSEPALLRLAGQATEFTDWLDRLVEAELDALWEAKPDGTVLLRRPLPAHPFTGPAFATAGRGDHRSLERPRRPDRRDRGRVVGRINRTRSLLLPHRSSQRDEVGRGGVAADRRDNPHSRLGCPR